MPDRGRVPWGPLLGRGFTTDQYHVQNPEFCTGLGRRVLKSGKEAARSRLPQNQNTNHLALLGISLCTQRARGRVDQSGQIIEGSSGLRASGHLFYKICEWFIAGTAVKNSVLYGHRYWWKRGFHINILYVLEWQDVISHRAQNERAQPIRVFLFQRSCDALDASNTTSPLLSRFNMQRQPFPQCQC